MVAPQTPDPVTQQALSYLNSGHAEHALKTLQAVCNEQNRNPEHWFLLGAAQAETGRFKEAEMAFRHVLILNPDHVNARANLGRILVSQGKYEEAIDPLRQALVANPLHHFANISLIDALTQLKHFDGAQNLCKKMIAAEPGNLHTLIRMGDIHLMQNRIDQAIALFEQALVINPESSLALVKKGLALQKSGNNDIAIELFKQAIQLAPDMDSAWNLLGVAYLIKANLSDAITSFEKAVEINPRNIGAADHLAKLYRHTGRNQDSIAVYKNILKIQPDHVRARFFLDAYTSQEKHKPKRIPVTVALEMYKDDDAGTKFDKSLQGALEYRAPEVLNRAIHDVLDIPEEGLDILELGCGSGLCGSKLADIAHTLIGTDLSPGMLAAAKQKNVYDKLYEADLIDVLSKNIAIADLIIAMDVLCFFGELYEIFEKAHDTLRINGIFGFSVVKPDTNEPWELNKYGHFAHSPDHLQSIAKKTGFKVIFIEEMVMRRELNEDRKGFICLYKRV